MNNTLFNEVEMIPTEEVAETDIKGGHERNRVIKRTFQSVCFSTANGEEVKTEFCDSELSVAEKYMHNM